MAPEVLPQNGSNHLDDVGFAVAVTGGAGRKNRVSVQCHRASGSRPLAPCGNSLLSEQTGGRSPACVCLALTKGERTEAALALGFGFVFNQYVPLEPQLPFGGGGREPEARVLEGTKT